MRTCSGCHLAKPLDEFPRKRKGYNYLCKPCQREYCRQHYARHRDKYIARVTRNKVAYRAERSAYINSLKNVPCADCGQRFPPYVMDFDHLPEHAKARNLSAMQAGDSWDRIKSEIAKCEIVCSNCHRIRTYERSHSRVGNGSQAALEAELV